ncbi:MAG: PhzF family phenazine biosynthesis protein [Gammaproteobacteria bacterium]
MSLAIYTADAFTDRPFAGNPAAVCLLEQARDADWMQRVATEMNLSETAFLVPRGDNAWDLRWFTPKTEVDLCGHATLASAHVLWNESGVSAPELVFHTRSGALKAVRRDDAIQLDFPSDPPVQADMPRGLEQALGVTPVDVLRGRDDLLVVLPDAAAVRGLTPDMAGLAVLPVRGVIVTAVSDQPGWDFVSRFFAPGVGVPEDPVTGSAHCRLAPYWAEKTGKTELVGYQASARGGVVGMRLAGARVYLRGQAVTTLAGRLLA